MWVGGGGGGPQHISINSCGCRERPTGMYTYHNVVLAADMRHLDSPTV